MTTLGWQTHWHKHPGVRSGEQLTLGERAADRMRNMMGSWPFVFVFFGIMITWAIANSAFYLGGSHGKHGFDPYPYILLNLFLSMLAGVQAAALLIAAQASGRHLVGDRHPHREEHRRPQRPRQREHQHHRARQEEH